MSEYYSYDSYDNPNGKKPRKNRGGIIALIIVLAIVLIGCGGAVGLGIAYVSNRLIGGNGSAPEAVLPQTGATATPAPTQELQELVPTPSPEQSEAGEATPVPVKPGETIYQVTTGEGDADLKSEDVAAKVAPSVVAIEVTVETNYYGRVFDSTAAGSGVIISKDGYVVTNYHVISGGKQATVILNNGEEHEAKLVGYNEAQDLALLKIEAENLQPAVFGNTADVKLGQNVMAIGNPLGEFAGTVSGGYVSALDREVVIDGQKMHYMQTDAAINEGNSGGALANMKGELIGIVSAKTIDVGVEGLGFAIPIDTVKTVIDDIMVNGHTATPLIGITMVTFDTDADAAAYRLNGAGIYISSVSENSPAAQAGLRSGDKLISIDGEAITLAQQVADIRDRHKVGDVLTFVIERNGTQYSTQLTLQAKEGGLPLA